jgi:hypothetical protein
MTLKEMYRARAEICHHQLLSALARQHQWPPRRARLDPGSARYLMLIWWPDTVGGFCSDDRGWANQLFYNQRLKISIDLLNFTVRWARFNSGTLTLEQATELVTSVAYGRAWLADHVTEIQSLVGQPADWCFVPE